MASFRQHGNGWQARIRRQGHPDITKTFEARQDAEKWARAVESSIDKGQFIDINEAQRTTLGDVIERYLAEVTPTMKSAVADTIRLGAFMRRPLARLSMVNLSAARIAAFRDERLKQVSAGTVIRELAYLSAIINHARREWGINVPNPVQMVRKPSSPPARARVLSEEEVSRLLHALEPAGRRSHWTKPAVQLALATAMRRGELLSLRWEQVDLLARRMSKNLEMSTAGGRIQCVQCQATAKSTRGRQPDQMAEAYPELQEAARQMLLRKLANRR